MAVSAAAGENLHFIISMGTILCDVLINLFCNDISQTVQQSRNIVSRFIPYIVWFNIAVLWLVFKRMKTISTNLRNFEPFILFVGTLLVDVVINLFCSDISQEIQQQTSVVGRFLPYLVLLATALLWFVGKRVLETRSQVETRQPSALQTSTPHGIFQVYTLVPTLFYCCVSIRWSRIGNNTEIPLISLFGNRSLKLLHVSLVFSIQFEYSKHSKKKGSWS